MTSPADQQERNAIEIFGDGSFSDDVGIGAWAFRVPSLQLQRAGTSGGRSALRFEFLAVLQGMEAVVDADTSELPLHVFSDCESTVSAVERLRAGHSLRNPEKYADRADLIPRLQAVLKRREVRVTRLDHGRLEHQACHRAAIAKLREETRNSPLMCHRAALRRLQARLAQMIRERDGTLNRLDKLDTEISLAQVEIAALELAIGQLPAGDVQQVVDVPAAGEQNVFPAPELTLPPVAAAPAGHEQLASLNVHTARCCQDASRK